MGFGSICQPHGPLSRRTTTARLPSPSRTSEHEAGSGVSTDSIHDALAETLVSAKNCPKEELRDGDAEGGSVQGDVGVAE